MNKRILSIFLAILLICGSFFIGNIRQIDKVYAETFTKSFNSGTQITENIKLTKEGYYRIELLGGAGGTCAGTIPGGSGGRIATTRYFTLEENINIHTYMGGDSTVGGDFVGRAGKGGDAIALSVNTDLAYDINTGLINGMIIGAGGGGGSCAYTQNLYTCMGGNVNAQNGECDNGEESSITCTYGEGTNHFSSGGGAIFGGFGRGTSNAASDGHNGATGGTVINNGKGSYYGAASGGAGSNYIDTSAALYNTREYNKATATSTSYRIEYLGPFNLPQSSGLSVQTEVERIYVAPVSETYIISLTTNGGDCITGTISLNKGDLLQVVRTNENTGGTLLVILNWDTLLMVAGSTTGDLTTTPEDIDTLSMRSDTTYSYYNGEYISGVNYDNTGSATTVLASITCKTATNDDVPQYVKGIVGALDRQTEVLEKIANNSNDSIIINQTPAITVVAGKEFGFYTIGNDATIGGTSKGITIINNNPKDGYIYIQGMIPLAGNYEVKIDGIIYVLNVIEEPASSNVHAVLQ